MHFLKAISQRVLEPLRLRHLIQTSNINTKKKRNMKRILLSLVLLATSIVAANAQTVIYVDADATGSNDGSSWANAYTSPKTALDSNTVIGAELWIAEGTYTPLGINDWFTLRLGEKLYGGFDGTETSRDQRDPEAHVTILSGDINGDDASGNYSNNASKLVLVETNTPGVPDEVLIVDGITFYGAYSTWGAGAAFGANQSIIGSKELRINNCTFDHNLCNYSPAFNFRSYADTQMVSVTNCIFSNNTYLAGYVFELDAGSQTGGPKQALIANNLFIDNYRSSTSAFNSIGYINNNSPSTYSVQFTNNTFVIDSTVANGSNMPGIIRVISDNSTGDIVLDFDNNLFYTADSTNFTLVQDIGSIPATSYFNSTNTNNGGNWSGLSVLTNSVIDTVNAPFLDFANGDFRPTTAYNTQGDVNSYDTNWSAFDLAGESRLNPYSGSIAIGAYEYVSCMPTSATILQLACLEYTSPSGKVWNATGTYYDTIQNACGLDSLMKFEILIVLNPTVTVAPSGTVLMANQGLATYQWYDCATNQPISGATDQTFQPTQTGDYAVEVTLDSCTALSDCHNVVVTGVNDLKKASNLNIYPNPANDIITVKHELSSNLEVSIYTVTGAQVSSTIVSGNTNTIDVSTLPAGYYILKAKAGNLEHTEKLIIQ
ncbi:MAG: hypothetical protein CL843_12065 [Crocinitomicaceae bacterium]|nr:hypothetical protein [Crocinitomicaceae bacterium]